MDTDFFFGRRDELDELDAATRTHRLVTICGPAGVGKSSLLREFGRRRGWAVVDLTDVSPTVPLEVSIAASLGTPLAVDADDASRRRALASLLDECDGRLLLDNAEHLVPKVAALVSEATNHRFVVGSRTQVGAATEHVVHLDPFEVSGDDSPALEFLRQRATRLGSTHTIRDDELEASRELVRRLDGLPLALELAAARLNLLRPAQLLERLSRSQDVLGTSGQRSLDDAIAASWNAASVEEQRALAALSLLDGPFQPELGEALIGERGLDLLQALRDRSVVVVDPDGRIRLLLAIRDYSRERLDDEDQRAAQRRLASHLAGMAPGWLSAASRLEPLAEVLQMRAHGRHLARVVAADGEPSELALCGAALAEVALLEGTQEQTLLALRKLDEALDHPEVLRMGIGRLERETGRLEEADRSFEMAEAAEGLLERGLTAQYRGDLPAARSLAEDGQRLASTDLERGRAALQLAGVAFHSGEYDEAREQFELALRHARRANDRRTEARALQNLGVVHTDQMRLDLARKCLRDAIEHHERAGDVLREAWGYNSLGVVELRAQDEDAGIAHFERAGALFDRVGHRVGAASTMANLAMIAVDFERWDDAIRYAIDALDRASAEEDKYIAGMSRLCLTVATWFGGDRDAAGRAFHDFESTIDRDGHVQLALSWDAAFGAFLAATGDPRADEVFARAEALLGDDDGHDVYARMFTIARCHRHLADARRGERDRREALLEVLEHVTGIDANVSEALRFSLRLLLHEAPPEWRTSIGAAAEARGDELLVSFDAAAFRPPDGDWQTLARSPSIWRLFEALIRARLDGRDAVTHDELQEAMWPGEVLTVESAANRLHVSLSKLRKLGLKSIIGRDDDGYFVDPNIVVRALR